MTANETTDAVAVVTGGNSGIGEAVVKRLVARGMTAVVAGRRQAENERVAREASGAGPGRAFPYQADVSREEDCLELVAHAFSAHGRLDVLVNNAGIGGMGPLTETDTAFFDRVLKTNLYSAYWCSREAYRRMREQAPVAGRGTRGAILNVASVCGLDAWAGTGVYSASKHGMVGLTRAMADEGAEDGIRVAAICPALVATPMTGVSGPDYITPDDVASSVTYLLDLGPAAWPRELAIPRRGAD